MSDLCLETSNEDTTKYLWNIWNVASEFKLDNENSLKGYSWAAHVTGFTIENLKILFDAGVGSNTYYDFIFITHGHADHCSQVRLHDKNPHKKEIIYCPIDCAELMELYISSGRKLSYGMKTLSEPRYEIKPVDHDYSEQIKIRGKNFILRTYECYHSVSCLGYGLSEIREVTKSEYLNLTPAEKKELGLKKVQLKEDREFPFIVYLGDTTIKVFDNQEIFKYKFIMCECTFLLDNHYEHAQAKYHTHWNDLKIVIEAHPECFFIIYHFSSRYSVSTIQSFFSHCPFTNVKVWINK